MYFCEMLIKHIIILLTMIGTLAATERPYWVFLEQETGSEVVQITSRAENRLQIRGAKHPPGNYAVSEHQLAQLRATGFRFRHVSRFLNAVSVNIDDDEQLQNLSNLPFVQSIKPVARRPLDRTESTSNAYHLQKSTADGYGASTTQNEVLHIPLIHSRGFDGSGVLVGVFDTGFLTDHEVFQNLDIEAQYDFIDGEPDASGLGHEHGINVLSVIGGYSPDQLIGPAHKASYLLARTEDEYSESRAEEDNWVAALEWADSLGVDIVTSSLNYFDEFDDPNENYPASALDGQTTICARAANIAAQRGILIVNSAGNEGPGVSSLWPPADSPNVLAVGSVNQQNNISYFSGRGPTFDGRIKPDVVAQGSAVFMATSVTGYKYGNGTSFSAPQVAGLAALLLQAHPSLTPDSVISIFQDAGDKSDAPDNSYGWGVPDLTGYFTKQHSSSLRNCTVYPNPASALDVFMVLPSPIADEIVSGQLYDIRGRYVGSLDISPVSNAKLMIGMPRDRYMEDQLFIISVQAGNNHYSGKMVYIKK